MFGINKKMLGEIKNKYSEKEKQKIFEKKFYKIRKIKRFKRMRSDKREDEKDEWKD